METLKDQKQAMSFEALHRIEGRDGGNGNGSKHNRVREFTETKSKKVKLSISRKELFDITTVVLIVLTVGFGMEQMHRQYKKSRLALKADYQKHEGRMGVLLKTMQPAAAKENPAILPKLDKLLAKVEDGSMLYVRPHPDFRKRWDGSAKTTNVSWEITEKSVTVRFAQEGFYMRIMHPNAVFVENMEPMKVKPDVPFYPHVICGW